MPTEGSKNTDSADVRLGSEDTDNPSTPGEGQTYAIDNGVRVVVEAAPSEPLGERPAKSAGREAWLDYCTSLGADRYYLDNDTEHVVDATPGAEDVEEHPPYTIKELQEYATRLGG